MVRRLIRRLKWSWAFEQQWKELVGKGYNWRNFEFIRIAAETGTYRGMYIELYVAFLGLCFELRVEDSLTKSVFTAKMDQRRAEADEMLRKEQEDIEREEREGE